jgi:hypothetical protein
MTKQKPLLFPSVPNAPAYLRRMPTKAEVPAGMIVVHNNVRPPRIGSRGFRAWLAHPVAGSVRCDCKQAVTHLKEKPHLRCLIGSMIAGVPKPNVYKHR